MFDEKWLDNLLSIPSQELIQDISKIQGDIYLLGAGGKIGPSLALMAKKAVREAGTDSKIIAVSRFCDPIAKQLLIDAGVEIISMDLLEDGAIQRLPDMENIIYLAGRKFGTADNESATWAMNASLPTLVSRRFKGSKIVVFSTGNVYPMVNAASGGCVETDNAAPIGEYGASSLARERIFEYASKEYASKVLIYRLNYALDLRYGVLYDIADKIINSIPISLNASCFNCVWQGYANEAAIRSLLHAESPAQYLNVSGPETISIKYAATMLGKYLGKEPIFEGDAKGSAFLTNAAKCFELFGYPKIGLNQMIKWQAKWLLNDGRVLGKPTHFEERKGNF